MIDKKTLSKQAMVKEPYPENFLLCFLKGTVIEIPELTDDIRAGIEYALSTLSYREKEVIRQRYVEGKSAKEIGEFFGVTDKMIRQNEAKAFRHLRGYTVLPYILYGISGNIKRLLTLEYSRGYNVGYGSGYEKGVEDTKKGVFAPETNGDVLKVPIDELDLKLVTRNCLIRASYLTIGDLSKLKLEEIYRIRNLGMKYMKDVARELHRYGVKHTAWDCFIQ